MILSIFVSEKILSLDDIEGYLVHRKQAKYTLKFSWFLLKTQLKYD